MGSGPVPWDGIPDFTPKNVRRVMDVANAAAADGDH
jgi:hypothetical protein